MATLEAVTAEARRLYGGGEPLSALRLLDAVVAAAPHCLDARIKVADCVHALGHPAAAIRVYRATGWYAIKAGDPLVAIVIAKVLESLEAEFDDLHAALVAYYGSDSELLGRASGKLGARISPPAGDTPISLPDPSRPVGADFALGAATRAADCLEGFDDYPDALHPIALLSELSESAVRRVLSGLIVGRLPGGATVIRQGEPGTSFFFVAAGEVVVFETVDGLDRELARLHRGSIFGEMALLSAGPRSATVTVVGEADLIEVTSDSLLELAGEMDQVAAVLHRFKRQRLLSNLMATSPLFRPFDRRQRRDLLRRFTSHEVAPGTDVIRGGDVGRGLFVVLSGDLEVAATGGGEPVQLATLRAGDVFGEMALLRSQPTTATVTAATRATVLFLGRDYVDRMVGGVPAIREYLEALAASRELDTRLAIQAFESEQDVIIMV